MLFQQKQAHNAIAFLFLSLLPWIVSKIIVVFILIIAIVSEPGPVNVTLTFREEFLRHDY